MKSINTRLFPRIISVLAMLAVTACACPDQNGEVMTPWDQVPAAVQKTVSAEANGQKVDKVEKETKDGTVTYEAKVTKKNGSRLIIKVDEDGKLIGVVKKSAEVQIPLKKVPTAARKTIVAQAGGQKITKVEKETVDGVLIYEAKVVNTDGSKTIIKVGKDGKLISVKTKKD